MRPLVFLDVDDVVCLSDPYGGYDLIAPDKPVDLFDRLFDPGCVRVLLEVHDEHRPLFVLTTSWLRFLGREGFVEVFKRTGLSAVASSLHPAWDAPQNHGEERASAIARWMAKNHRGEPFVVIDDWLSGTGLPESPYQVAGRVNLCFEGQGLQTAHLPAIRAALQLPCSPQ